MELNPSASLGKFGRRPTARDRAHAARLKIQWRRRSRRAYVVGTSNDPITLEDAINRIADALAQAGGIIP